MADVDWGSVESRLRERAAQKGVSYDQSDLEGVQRQMGYDRNAGRNVEDFVNEAFSRYDQRAGNTPGDLANDSSQRSGNLDPNYNPSDNTQEEIDAAYRPAYGQAQEQRGQSASVAPGGEWGQMVGSGSGGPSSGPGSSAAYEENKQRSDALYNTLLDRSRQSLNISRTDPAVRGQADAFAAQQMRGMRNQMSDLAESSGPYAQGFLRGEQRMANERYGATTGAFEAELMNRELGARRQEIQDALSQMGGQLSADQQLSLQRELGLGGLGVQRELGLGGLNNDLLRTMLQNQQFYSNLGLQGRTQDDYYDLVRRGHLGNGF